METTKTVSASVPPIDAVVPQTPTYIFAVASVALAASCLLVGFRHAVKYKSALPILLVVAGFCTVVLESIVCHLGHVWHPVIGQATLYSNNGVSVPIYLAFTYCFYFGLIYMLLFPKMISNSFTTGFLWKTYLGAVIWAVIVETYVVLNDIWIYYDHQALWLFPWSLPLFWAFVNMACMYVAVTLIKVFLPILKGWKQLLVIPLSPIGAYMGHLGAGFPFYAVTNSPASGNQWFVELSGVASVLISLLLVFICSKVLVSKNSYF